MVVSFLLQYCALEAAPLRAWLYAVTRTQLTRTYVHACTRAHTDAPQPIKWLGHVAIARMNSNYTGWAEYGVPKEVHYGSETGEVLNMADQICKVLQHEDHVFVTPSLDPKKGSLTK